MKDTNKTRHALEEALRNLPQDYALQGVRGNIVSAIRQINELETRRDRRATLQANLRRMEEEKQKLANAGLAHWQLTLPQYKNALNKIDSIISDELAKIDKAKDKNNDSELQTIFD